MAVSRILKVYESINLPISTTKAVRQIIIGNSDCWSLKGNMNPPSAVRKAKKISFICMGFFITISNTIIEGYDAASKQVIRFKLTLCNHTIAYPASLILAYFDSSINPKTATLNCKNGNYATVYGLSLNMLTGIVQRSINLVILRDWAVSLIVNCPATVKAHPAQSSKYIQILTT